jgi:hypothetical protein
VQKNRGKIAKKERWKREHMCTRQKFKQKSVCGQGEKGCKNDLFSIPGPENYIQDADVPCVHALEKNWRESSEKW